MTGRAFPRAKVADAGGGQDYGEIRLFTAQGRFGCVRYIGYTTGWLSLLLFVPLAALVFWFIPGSQDESEQ